ncbi:MAG: exodeoxyribonuclease VII large subunit [Elusimicrobia bacterium HGW-Elusimicrobia-4]|nr:MAG: exodeoxyribonuclease VII large subunit [Elusimicrobia bacterium HGW-Elusimicrobia-4]
MSNIYKRLINWRDEQAKKEDISDDKRYFVLPNSTLKNIADANPQMLSELSKVKGIGEKKLKQYGNQIIDLMLENQTEKNSLSPGTLFDIKPVCENAENKPVTNNDRVLTISQLNNQIKRLLNNSFKEGVWVCGEIYRYDLDVIKADTRPYRQVYFELVEQDSQTKERKATISAMIWGEDRNIIEAKMYSVAAGLMLKDGLQIKAKCFVDFYPPQGKIQIRVTDIEPEYTVGKMALERKLILEKLRKTGLIDKNKKIEIPPVPLNVGLITSAGSAAYNDFIDELKKSGYSFKVFLCDARMQGTELEGEVRAAIFTLNKYPVDVIAIVRGGGIASDLMGFDKEGVAVAIANSKNPVLTGIGHQIDRTIADEVSNQSFKTPTATAQFIVEKVRGFELDIEELFGDILKVQKQILSDEKERLKNITGEVKSATIMFVKELENNISQTAEKIKWNLKKFFEDGFRKLGELERLNNSKNPVNILKLGFGLIYASGGRIIKSVENVSVGSDVKIELRDGKLGGKITAKEKN